MTSWSRWAGGTAGSDPRTAVSTLDAPGAPGVKMGAMRSYAGVEGDERLDLDQERLVEHCADLFVALMSRALR